MMFVFLYFKWILTYVYLSHLHKSLLHWNHLLFCIFLKKLSSASYVADIVLEISLFVVINILHILKNIK
jgi:hypothetical protein